MCHEKYGMHHGRNKLMPLLCDCSRYYSYSARNTPSLPLGPTRLDSLQTHLQYTVSLVKINFLLINLFYLSILILLFFIFLSSKISSFRLGTEILTNGNCSGHQLKVPLTKKIVQRSTQSKRKNDAARCEKCGQLSLALLPAFPIEFRMLEGKMTP